MNGLARTHSNLGEQLILRGRFDEARDNSQKAVSIQEELVKEFRENLNFKIELILSLSNLGNMYHVNNQLVLAQDFYERGLRLATTLAKDNPAVTDLQVRYASLTNYFGLLLVTTGHHKEALDRFNDVLDLQNRNQEVPSNTYMRTHLGRAKALQELGQINDALLATKASIHIGETDPGGQPLASFDLACARALYSVLIAKQSKELTQAEQAAKQDYADKAIKDLKHAVAGGLRNVALIRSDPDLMTLKERPDFKQLLHELEADQKLGKLVYAAV
jgi:tetratricopeptide (TPR) repeat protein